MPRKSAVTASVKAATLKGKERLRKSEVPFSQKLVLQQWIFSVLEAKDLRGLCQEDFRHPDFEGTNAEGVSHFHLLLTNLTVERAKLPNALLRAYDENIVRHTRRLNERREARGESIRWKYFQYLALLFTEIYLDWYFRDRAGLLVELNATLNAWNATQEAGDWLPAYGDEDLQKIALWQATGSGKTLLLHANLLQFLHYVEKAGKRRELNKIILLTPNEGLSQQHLKEFALSGIDAASFDKDGRGQGDLFSGTAVEVLEVTRLAEESKERQVAVSHFEGNNLVLVDEGHRGAKGEKWMDFRNQLCAGGFSFEYSATFGQAVKNDPTLTANYARWILFDYSYKHFHDDGYGKHFRIFNLKQEQDAEQQKLYLTAAVLSFYQQLKVWLENREAFAPFGVERPLWVFFGAKVNAEEASDIEDVLVFLAEFVGGRAETVRRLDLLLRGADDMVDKKGVRIFGRAFEYLNAKLKLTGEVVFDDILRTVFNAPAGGKLHVKNLKSAAGELSLSLGVADAFGVVNVGDEAKLAERLKTHRTLMAVEDADFGASLFHGLNQPGSQVHLLLGSRKFTEGWNSWRVTAIGLMNLGKNEGPSVIQLFGRGVRLKGWNMTLKRSSALAEHGLITAPHDLRLVETLDVFGVKANYMDTFREVLEAEGIKTGEDMVEMHIPALPTLKDLAGKKLKVVRLKAGLDFRRDGDRPKLDLMLEHFRRKPVVVDWYPRVEAMDKTGRKSTPLTGLKKQGELQARHVAFLNEEALYQHMQEVKNQRGYYNLALPREAVGTLLRNRDWYKLLIPPSELDFTKFGQVRIWQQIAEALLSTYCERYYKFHRQRWEADNSEVRDLDWSDANFDGLSLAGNGKGDGYQVMVSPEETALIDQLNHLAKDVAGGELKGAALQSLSWNRHLYVPLFHIGGGAVIEIKPVALNTSEWTFLQDLKAWHNQHADFFKTKELYLLRNRSRKGIGFFEAGNFYPDFILWLLDGKHQHVAFIDPKGLRMCAEGFADPKISFHTEIKSLEAKIRQENPTLSLHSFILSATPFQLLLNFGTEARREDFEQAGVLFQSDGGPVYMEKLFSAISPKT